MQRRINSQPSSNKIREASINCIYQGRSTMDRTKLLPHTRDKISTRDSRNRDVTLPIQSAAYITGSIKTNGCRLPF
jgi:hypothetical protein